MFNAWFTHWKVPETTLVSSQADYRDTLPTRPEEIAEQLASVVQVFDSCNYLNEEVQGLTLPVSKP